MKECVLACMYMYFFAMHVPWQNFIVEFLYLMLPCSCMYRIAGNFRGLKAFVI